MNPNPPITRETIYAALFAFWQALTLPTVPVPTPAFKLATRKVTTWDQVAPEDAPALLMQQVREVSERRRGLPTKWTLEVKLFLYVHTGANTDADIVPSQILNPLLDAIDGALVVDDINNNACTLGGLVSSCQISGAIETYPGDLGDEAVAVVPLSIVIAQ